MVLNSSNRGEVTEIFALEILVIVELYDTKNAFISRVRKSFLLKNRLKYYI